MERREDRVHSSSIYTEFQEKAPTLMRIKILKIPRYGNNLSADEWIKKM